MIKAGADAANNGLAQQVGRQLTEQALHAAKVPNTVLAQISNLPGKPLVQVRMEAPLSTVMQMVPARVLPSIEVYKSISLVENRQLYVPDAFTETRNVLYRGMRFAQLSDLENILLKGIELRRSAYSELYFAYIFSEAMRYALPYATTEEVCGDFPVVVKVPVTDQLPVSQTGVTAQAYRDLSAEFISDVMVFLEINGRADWYKAIMENNKLVLISTPVTYISGRVW